ncbi:MAG: CrpP-related protein [Rhizobacter sp.]
MTDTNKQRTQRKHHRDREAAELARQGAKSAVRRESSAVNPMDRDGNSPPATGESVTEWKSRRDAWQAGYDQQSKVIQSAQPPTPVGRDDDHD